jgi:polysaccharide biosynthesis/export protein
MRGFIVIFGLSCLVGGAWPAAARQDGQGQTASAPAASSAAMAPVIGASEPSAAGIEPPPEYRIGVGDLLTVVFWRDRDLSGEVAVRPDGRITLPLINEMYVAGLTLPELREKVAEEAKRFITDPTASVLVRQINSRNVFITGQVAKPGAYPLYGPTRVLQLIASAGGLREFADKDSIVIIRHEEGAQTSLRFNYKDVVKRKNLGQNIELKPGDTVVVP